MRFFLMSALLAATVAAPMPALAFAFDDNRDDKIVCRSNRDHAVGTRIRAERVCRTRAEWRQLEEHTQRELQQVRDGQAPNAPAAGSATAGGPA